MFIFVPCVIPSNDFFHLWYSYQIVSIKQSRIVWMGWILFFDLDDTAIQAKKRKERCNFFKQLVCFENNPVRSTILFCIHWKVRCRWQNLLNLIFRIVCETFFENSAFCELPTTIMYGYYLGRQLDRSVRAIYTWDEIQMWSWSEAIF